MHKFPARKVALHYQKYGFIVKLWIDTRIKPDDPHGGHAASMKKSDAEKLGLTIQTIRNNDQ